VSARVYCEADKKPSRTRHRIKIPTKINSPALIGSDISQGGPEYKNLPLLLVITEIQRG
jgi:hypothetical protein